MAIVQEYLDMLEERGGYRECSIADARFLLRVIDRLDQYTLRLWAHKRLCHAILHPSHDFNFWNMAISLYRHAYTRTWSIQVMENPMRVEITPPSPPTTTIDRCVPVVSFTLRYTDAKKTIDGKILRYRYLLSMSMSMSMHNTSSATTTPVICGVVDHIENTVRLMDKLYWKARMHHVLQQLKMTPAHIKHQLIENGISLDTWEKDLDRVYFCQHR